MPFDLQHLYIMFIERKKERERARIADLLPLQHLLMKYFPFSLMGHKTDFIASFTAIDLPVVSSAIKWVLASFKGVVLGEEVHLCGGGRHTAITSSNVSKVIRVIGKHTLLCAERCVLCAVN